MARTVNLVERAARRDAILDATQRLLLSKGYERLTVQDILDDLHISKGAFYHYFDSKPAVIDGLTERLVDESAQVLAPILDDPETTALEKLQRFFDEVIRWKSVRQNLFIAMLPVWYAAENLTFRAGLELASAQRVTPLLTAIVRQGVDENLFATAYPDHAGAVIFALIQSLQNAMAERLLSIDGRSPVGIVDDMIAAYRAHIEAIERYLGVPAGALYRVDPGAMNDWITARRAHGEAK